MTRFSTEDHYRWICWRLAPISGSPSRRPSELARGLSHSLSKEFTQCKSIARASESWQAGAPTPRAFIPSILGDSKNTGFQIDITDDILGLLGVSKQLIDQLLVDGHGFSFSSSLGRLHSSIYTLRDHSREH